MAPVLIVAPCYTGPDADPGELRPLRTATGLARDGVRAHSFLAQQHVFNPGYGMDRDYWKGHFVRELPDELIDELLERGAALGRAQALAGLVLEAEPGAQVRRRPFITGQVSSRHAAIAASSRSAAVTSRRVV